MSAAKRLYGTLLTLHDEMLKTEADAAAELKGTARAQRASARNLVHYLALRKHDLRSLQRDLAELGLSSLGRCEAHALASVDSVLTALRALLGLARTDALPVPPVTHRSGPLRLNNQSNTLFGPAPAQRSARIMVTLPTEAATDPQLIDSLFKAGMDLARINCAHDDAAMWSAMIGHLRQASRRLRRPCRVLMDLAGPKLRTGAIAPGEQVYEGMVVGECAREDEMVVNAVRPKEKNNIRTHSHDDAVKLPTPKIHSLETAIEWIQDDELVEVTPKNIRIRKKYLAIEDRRKANKKVKV